MRYTVERCNEEVRERPLVTPLCGVTHLQALCAGIKSKGMSLWHAAAITLLSRTGLTCPQVESTVLYGFRAMDNCRPGSVIDPPCGQVFLSR